jgi:hypothetical protein
VCSESPTRTATAASRTADGRRHCWTRSPAGSCSSKRGAWTPYSSAERPTGSSPTTGRELRRRSHSPACSTVSQVRRQPHARRPSRIGGPEHRARTAEMGAIVSWPGTCQHGAVNRHQGTPGGNVFDRAAGAYGTVGPDFFGYFGRRLVDRIGIPRGGRVVDLACGTGAALVAAGEAVGAEGLSVGVDLSVAMLRRAGATDAGSGPQLRLACMDATHLAIRSRALTSWGRWLLRGVTSGSSRRELTCVPAGVLFTASRSVGRRVVAGVQR